jgi:hypothetical protein
MEERPMTKKKVGLVLFCIAVIWAIAKRVKNKIRTVIVQSVNGPAELVLDEDQSWLTGTMGDFNEKTKFE